MKDFLKNMLLVLKKVLNLFIFPKVLLIYANYIAVPLPKSPKGVTRIQIFIRRMNETVAETEAPTVGHLIGRAHSLEKTLMLGKIEGRWRRGQQRMGWLASPTQ